MVLVGLGLVRIMKRSATEKLSCGRKALLGSAVVVALAGPLMFGAVNAPLGAQSQSGSGTAPLPSFEVASIKPNRSGDNRLFVGMRPGRFVSSSTTKEIIEFAYDIRSDAQLQGAPGWVDSDRYDINAKIADSEYQKLLKLSPEHRMDPVRPMVQSLLADRYRLKVSRGTRDLPIYALVVASGGPKLTEAKGPVKGFSGSMMRYGSVTFTDADMSQLAFVLSTEPELGERLVLDETGLRAKYNFAMHWTPSVPEAIPNPNGSALSNPPSTDLSGPSIFTALKEQLGLRLEPRKGPVTVVVIDSIQKPLPN
jgi:uncharacterized protein (TIGR03435 family)